MKYSAKIRRLRKALSRVSASAAAKHAPQGTALPRVSASAAAPSLSSHAASAAQQPPPRRPGPFEAAAPPTLAEPNGRHLRGGSAADTFERPTGATLRSALRSVLPLCALALSACSATKAVESASGKNLNLDGYLMLGDVETASTETGTPTGKLIIGRVTYKSRKVAIPADQKVPTTGYYKATKTKSLFGTEEEIIEYDFTSESPDNLTPFLQSLKQGDPK